MIIEAGYVVYKGKLLENAKLELPGKGDYYFETVIVPGFSDSHAHPQVIDVGRGGWRNSMEWIRNRELKVNEASLRADVELSSKLAKVTLLLSALEGTTLIAMVGSLKANLRAVNDLVRRPRVVLMPTLMSIKGWDRLEHIKSYYSSLNGIENSFLRLGLFIHSISLTDALEIVKAYEYSRRRNLPLGIHLSEGEPELKRLISLIGTKQANIVGVHCIENEDYNSYGIKVVHCPLSNLYLYRRTSGDVERIAALGSDWPLLTGSMLNQYKAALRIHGKRLLLLRKATLGGYEAYHIDCDGDLIAFDEGINRLFIGNVKTPAYVFVKSKPIVIEKSVGGLRLNDVIKIRDELIKKALERHGVY